MKKKVVRNRDKEKGAILVVATIVVVAMLIMATPFLFKLSGQYRSTERANKALAAINLAEAGCDRAVWELNHGMVSTWVYENNRLSTTISNLATSSETPVGVGDISIEITPLSGDLRTVIGEGEVDFIKPNNNVYRKVQVNVEKRYKMDLIFALFGRVIIDAAALTLVDSYDSRDIIAAHATENPIPPPVYDPDLDAATYQTSLGNIGSNGSIEIEGNSGVYGSASVFVPDPLIPTTDLSDVFYQKLTGDTEKLQVPTETMIIPGEYELKQNIVPTIPWQEPGPPFPARIRGKYPPLALGTGNYVYDNISLNGGQELIIQGNVNIYIKGDLNMAALSTLQVLQPLNYLDPSTYNKLTIYLGGNMVVDSNASLNNASALPSNLSILGLDSCESIEISSNDDFFGTIYARNSDITINSGGSSGHGGPTGGNEFYGSIMGNKIILDSNVGFHYDEALGEGISNTSGIPYYVVVAWQEKPI